MAEPIFFDVLPKFGFAAMEAGLAKFKSAAGEAGKAAGVSLTGETDAALSKIQASYTAAANAATKAGDTVAKANASIGTTAQKAAESAGVVEVRIKQLAAALETYGAGTAEVVAAENRLQVAWAKSDTAIHAHAVAFNEANAAMVRNTEATTAAAAAQARMVEAQGTTSAAVMASSRVINGIGMASLALFTGAVYESAKAAGDFQQSQMRLVSSAGETRDGLKVVSDGLLKLAGDVGTSAGELSKGMYTVESAGYHGADGLKVMTAAAQGAKAENADLRKVTDGLTTSMHDFGYAPDQATLVMSKLVTAVGESKANFEEFTGSLHSVEPVAAAAKISLDDVYGSLAQITQAGVSADQATQNMADAIRHLQGPTDVQAAAMAKFGISATDVQQHLSERGLSGTMANLADTIRNQLDPAGNISVQTLNQNAQAAVNAADMISKMSPAAAATAQAFANGAITRKEFTAAIKGSTADDAAQLSQFGALELKLDGFSKQFANGRSLVETYGQALKEVTGSVAGANVALQLAGTPEKAEETASAVRKVAETTTDADGKVKGFGETQETLNAKMADAKAAFGAAAIELGDSFIPMLSSAADGLANLGRYLSENKGVLEGVTYTVGLLGGAWVVTKAAMALGSLVSTIGSGMAIMGGFVMGLAGKYDALAVSAGAAAEAEAAAATGGFAKGGAAGAALRGGAGLAGLAGSAAVVAPIGLGLAIYGDGGPESDASTQRSAAGGGRAQAGRFGAAPSPNTTSGPGNTTPAPSDTIPGGSVGGHGAPGRAGLSQAAKDAAARSAEAQNAVDGTVPNDFASAATAAGFNPRPDVTDPGAALTPEESAAAAKAAKAPAGDKNDPIWIAHDSLDAGKGGTGGSGDVYNPFAQFQSQGFTPASVVGMLTTWALNEAAGNPYGKLANSAKQRGDDPSNPMYVTSVDVDKAQTELNRAVQQYGPDSTQAQTAAAKLQGTQAAVGTAGGYFDRNSGGLSARLPGGGISTVPGGPGAEGWRDTVAATVAKYGPQMGIPPDKYGAWTNAIVSQIGTESHGDANADNPNDSNGQGGRQHVSGLLQYLPSSYANSGGKLTGLPYLDPVGQIAGALFASRNPDGSPAGIGHGVGWGPTNQPIRNVPAAVPTAPPAPPAGGGGLFGNSNIGGDGAVLPSLSNILGGGGGSARDGFSNSPIVAGPPGGGPLGIGAGAGGQRPMWPARAVNPQVAQTGFGIGGGAAAGNPAGARAVPGMSLATNAAATANGAGVGAAGASGGRQFGGGQSGKGFGIGGGLIGGAESAAATAANIVAPGSGVAVEKGTELINRAIGYAGQLAGIGVSGLLETFGLNDSALADPGKSLIGRIAGGFAGAHKTGDNVAGQTQPPLKPPDGTPASGNGSGPPPGPVNAGKGAGSNVYIENLHNHGNPGDGQNVAKDIDRHLSSGGVGQTR